jgi:hypothetical protein
MMVIGVLLVVLAAVLIVLGVVGTVANWILYVGLALVVVGAFFLIWDRQRARR